MTRSLFRWSIATSIVVLSGLWSLPRAQATVPLGQKDDPPAEEGVTPSMRPPPTTAAGPGQHADSDRPRGQRPSNNSEPPATNTHLGIGYKIGNGLGFLGADAILSPVPHLALDFQFSAFGVGTANGTAYGTGLAPMLQLLFGDPGGAAERPCVRQRVRRERRL